MNMDKKDVNDIRKIDLTQIKPSGFVDEPKLEKAIKQLNEIKVLVEELMNIRDRVTLPSKIVNQIISLNNQIPIYVSDIERHLTGMSPAQITSEKQIILENISEFYDQCFNENHKESIRLLEYYAIAKSFDRITEEDLIKGFNSLKQGLDVKVAQAGSLIQELNQKSLEVDTIVKELKKKSSQQTVSDYAVVFGEEAVKYKRFARNWLWAGIAISILFIAFMFWSTTTNILRTEIINEETGHFIRYNFTNLASKVIIIAVIVFIMSFAFKQYSINRHLQTLSQHRQNALNSYKLLTASISGDDTSSRNTLMIQIAKAIYEHSQSTGFLNDKGQNVNSGIVELTKIIGKNGS